MSGRCPEHGPLYPGDFYCPYCPPPNDTSDEDEHDEGDGEEVGGPAAT